MSTLKKLYPHTIAFLIFFVIAAIYFKPVIKGKNLFQSDLVQLKGIGSEIQKYEEKGETILWSNKQFGGMPNWVSSEKNIFHLPFQLITKIFPREFILMVFLFASVYLTMIGFTKNLYLSFLTGLAYAFSTFNIISIEAGHINKVYAMGCFPAVLGGVVLFYRKKTVYSFVLLTLFLGWLIYFNHVQITYYTLIAIIIYVAIEFFNAIKNKILKDFLKKSFILLGIAILCALSNIVMLWTMWEYQKVSNRGPSELSINKNEGGGLDKEYALQWSNGKMETFTLLVPYFYGGASNESLDKDSETYQTLINRGVPRQNAKNFAENAPLYWGDQPFTAGPIYFGAPVVLLFIFGVFYLKSNLKWWALSVAAITIMLSWGRNFELLTDFFFYNIPLYNKFRTVSMILSVTGFIFPFLGFLAYFKLTGTIDKERAKKALLISLSIVGGFLLIFLLGGGALFNFKGEMDARLPEWLIGSIVDDRRSLFMADTFRSLVFVLIGGGIVWLTIYKKIEFKYLCLIFSVVVLMDLWFVNKRYLNDDDFISQRKIESTHYTPSKADRQILGDTSYYRVFNLTRNITGDGMTSYFHYSIGGYSAIKIRRFQDLIDHHISKVNKNVLNMLNVKYFIVKQGEQVLPQRNPETCGPVWLVDEIKLVENPDKEIQALNEFNPNTTAIVDDRFKEMIKSTEFEKTSSDYIKLVNYHPEKMVYKYESSNESAAVFSEIYYHPGWEVYIDGKRSAHFRANYVLRAMTLPAGEHTIEFKFNPPSYKKGEILAIIASILIIIFSVGLYIYRRKILADTNNNEY